MKQRYFIIVTILVIIICCCSCFVIAFFLPRDTYNPQLILNEERDAPLSAPLESLDEIAESLSTKIQNNFEETIKLYDLMTEYGELDISKILSLNKKDIVKLSGFTLGEKYGRSSDDYLITLSTGTMYKISYIVDEEYPRLIDIYGYQKISYCEISYNGKEFMGELNIEVNNPKIKLGNTCYTIGDVMQIEKKRYPFVHIAVER